jgi:NTP pyrophosphatase (non-canonical NTP hydrolase)
MSTFSNGLTSEEDEALSLVAEECAEVIVAIQKIQRHGFLSGNPFNPTEGNNRIQLMRELGDLLASIDILNFNSGLSSSVIEQNKQYKLNAVSRWLHHARVPCAPKSSES